MHRVPSLFKLQHCNRFPRLCFGEVGGVFLKATWVLTNYISICEIQQEDDGCHPLSRLLAQKQPSAGVYLSQSVTLFMQELNRIVTSPIPFFSFSHPPSSQSAMLAAHAACAMCTPFRWKINKDSFISKGSRYPLQTQIGHLRLEPFFFFLGGYRKQTDAFHC